MKFDETYERLIKNINEGAIEHELDQYLRRQDAQDAEEREIERNHDDLLAKIKNDFDVTFLSDNISEDYDYLFEVQFDYPDGEEEEGKFHLKIYDQGLDSTQYGHTVYYKFKIFNPKTGQVILDDMVKIDTDYDDGY